VNFREIFLYEVRHQFRRVPTWLSFAAIVGLVVLFLTEVLEQEAKSGGNLYSTAPFLISMAMVFVSMMGLVVTASLFGDAAARDAEARMDPLFYAAPLTRFDYLGGRFLGAFAVNAALLVTVPVGLILGQLFYLDPATAGPFRAATYLQPFFALLLPNLFATAAIVFAMAALTRKAMVAYGGGVLLFLGSLITEEGMAERLEWRNVASLVDPFGFTAMSELIQYWTPAERNLQLIPVEGFVLWNRLTWMLVGSGMLALLGWRFRFARDGERTKVEDRQSCLSSERQAGLPVLHLQFGFGAQLRQMCAIAWHSFTELTRRAEAMGILALGIIVVFIAGWDAWNVLDTPTWPVTYIVARSVIGGSAPLIFLLAALYAGELVWHARDTRTADILDAAPVPNWVPLLGRFGAIVIALVALQGVMMLGGILLQTLQGYTNYELGLYVKILFGFQLADYLLWAALAMLLHVVVNQKYVAHLIFVAYFIFAMFARHVLQWIEHNMLLYPAAPGWLYSDMSGFEPSLEPFLWFKLYWGAWALLGGVIANLLWARGRETGLRHRIVDAWRRLTRPAGFALTAALVLLVAVGGFVFYNTNVLNTYRTREERIAMQVRYEREYKQFEKLPQPMIARADLRIELHPERRTAALSGTYLLENRSGKAIEAVHVITNRDLEARTLTFDRPATRVRVDEELGYHIFQLAEALRPGETVRLRFGLHYERRDFTNDTARGEVVGNGTHFQREWMPVIGYQPEKELLDEGVRNAHGLPDKKRLPPLDDPEGRRQSAHIRDADWFHLSTIIGTAPSQTAIAPGSLRRQWMENGRRYFHYESDAPIRNNYPILSAAYAVRREQWNGIPIEIYYHPTHPYNVERVLKGAKAALQYHAENFSPYQHKELRVVEFPRHGGTYARANPGTITNSEGFGFIARPEQGIDYPSLVVGHEVAHQWWGHQLVPARVEGGPVLGESLAHYGTLMVAEKTYGRDATDRFRELLLHQYLIGRQNRRGEEVPLLRSNDQKYIHYDKGALVMYALRDLIGEAQVNTALRRLLEKHRFSTEPFPRTRELYVELQAVTPPQSRYLLVDLIEDITLWSFRTHSVQATPAANGTYSVTLHFDAEKLKADRLGQDHPAPMHDFVDVGVYGADDQLLYLKKHRIRSGTQSLTVTVPRKPARAGIDPRHVLLEKERGDNVRDVS
jgi:ABC-type transport system involved in multi-copper enzyme maturation permease subunit